MSYISELSSMMDGVSARLVNTAAPLMLFAALVSTAFPALSAESRNKIILIGGPTSTYFPGSHDFPSSIKFIETILKQSPEVAAHSDIVVEAHPYEWPPAEELKGAATLVFNYSGVDRHPLLDPDKRNVVAKLVDQRVGLVALHQTFTLPEDDTSVPLLDWLGGARYGMADRTTQPVQILVTSTRHPLIRGLETFVHYDEFYPTIHFNDQTGKLTPIWSGELPIHFVRGQPTAGAEVATYTLAWAYERDNGGRSFAFSGAHFVESMDSPQARTMLLNAILWTAGKDVPHGGATTTAALGTASRLVFPPSGRDQERMTKAVVSKPKDYVVVEASWGQVEWHVSGELKNSDTMTTGIATILPGHSNPLHLHPNCDEVLHVLDGRIRHSMNGVIVEMTAGDTVSIPKGVQHNAVNIADIPARLAISFSSAWREVVGEYQ